MDDFFATQLAACGPLDFIRFWVPAGENDQYRLVVEVVREEADGTFSIIVPGDPEERARTSLDEAGFEGRVKRVTGRTEAEVADAVRAVLAIVVPDATKLSLTHGQRHEMERRRRLEAVVAAANEILSSGAAPGAWRNDTKVPVQFHSGTVQITLWPKESPPDVVLEIWAFVASALPDRPEVGALIARCNEGFSFGRLVRQDGRLWYRDIIHAEPLSHAALNFAVRMAASTARQFGPRFAELGAVDGSAPEPTPADVPERPPDSIVTPTAGYL